MALQSCTNVRNHNAPKFQIVLILNLLQKHEDLKSHSVWSFINSESEQVSAVGWLCKAAQMFAITIPEKIHELGNLGISFRKAFL